MSCRSIKRSFNHLTNVTFLYKVRFWDFYLGQMVPGFKSKNGKNLTVSIICIFYSVRYGWNCILKLNKCGCKNFLKICAANQHKFLAALYYSFLVWTIRVNFNWFWFSSDYCPIFDSTWFDTWLISIDSKNA